MKTYLAKPSEIEKKWLLIDAKDQVLGRLATKIAMILMGKHKTDYAPHQDGGDYVIVVNAKEVKVTGAKADSKIYWSHSSHQPGKHKEVIYKDLQAKKPEEIIRLAVKRMLPKNNMGHKLIKNLKICAGSSHPYAAQKPVEVK